MHQATRAAVATVGVCFGIGGLSHGFFEAIQGNTATDGFIIDAVEAGASWTRWPDGGEAAFTVIPNFLVTGIAAMVVSVAVIVWSLRHVHRHRHGPLIFLTLFVLLFAVGGGIGQVAFFVPAFAAATRIHGSLDWWHRMLPDDLRRSLAATWRWLVGAAAVLILAALPVAVFGWLPGIDDIDLVLTITLVGVAVSLILFLVGFVAAFAADIEAETTAGARVGPATASAVS